MKRLFAVVLLIGFSVAVCHAVPYASGFSLHKTELSKKHFELQPFEMACSFEVPAAPAVVNDLVVPEVKQSFTVVNPQSNSPPGRNLSPQSYSMAHWRY